MKLIRVKVVLVCVMLMAGVALAVNVTQMSWDTYGAGTMGNFDLDLQVNNGLSGPFTPYNATYGTHSVTSTDASGFFIVTNRLGFVLTHNSPEFVRDQNAGGGGLNAPTQLPANTSGAPFTQEGRWTHETSTVAFNPATTSRKWTTFWHTMVKSHPFSGSGDPYYIPPSYVCGDNSQSAPLGKNFPANGWIGMKHWSNTSDSQPNPDLTTLDAKETRLFVGLGYDNSLQSITNSWATGTPFDPVPGNSKYAVYSEPGAYLDTSTGTLYVAMSGNYCVGSQGYNDVLLVKSTDDGATWQYIGVVLTAAQATAIDSTWVAFTASSLHQNPSDGTIRLIVTGVSTGGIYQGIVEFEFSNIATGTLLTVGGNPAVQGFEAKQPGNFTGAGTFNLSTGKHVEGQVNGGTTTFTEWELSW
jgi:hypothetical protein